MSRHPIARWKVISIMTNNTVDSYSKKEQDNIALVKRFFKTVWDLRRPDDIKESVSPDSVSHYDHDVIKGFENWKESIYEVFIKGIPDITFEIEVIIADGDNVSTQWNLHGVNSGEFYGMPPSGKPVNFRGMSWFKIRNGIIMEKWTHSNMSHLYWKTLAELNTLKGILPLCSYCKKVRDDKGYWEQVDNYIHKYSAVDVSHSICPECVKTNFPTVYAKMKSNKESEINR